MSDLQKKRIGVFVVSLLLVVLYVGTAGMLIAMDASGRSINWQAASMILGLSGPAVVYFAIFAYSLVRSTPKERFEETMPAMVVEINVETTYSTPAIQPLIRRKELFMLLGAVVAGLIGGFLALSFLKKDKRP